eukprot:4864392-Prymnesium_polylepis.1
MAPDGKVIDFVKVSRNGNWRLQLAEHGVAPSGNAPSDGLSILTPETPSVSYGCSAAGTNQKPTP